LYERKLAAAVHALLIAAALACAPVAAQPTPPPARQVDAASGQMQTPRLYSLPPEKLQRAIEYAHARYWLHFLGSIYGIAVLLFILVAGLAAKFRDCAEAASKRRLLQAIIFVPLLIFTNDVLSLPLGVYGQHLELKFEQSIQSWPSWFWDWTKAELLTFAVAVLLAFILYGVIRRSPRRWWLYFWLAALPILFVGAFVEPIVIEPLFYKFEPLAAKHDALVVQLEKVVARGGLAIPPERMFEMKASEKLNSPNAYVTGFGASKRVVVWDTTLSLLTTPEILYVFGHEMGHYVLGHVRDTLIYLALLVLILLYIGYRALRSMLRRWGAGWKVRGVDDWASLPALLLLFAIFSFLTEPLINAYSRQIEHNADVYGIEVIHGLVLNGREVAAHSFQVMGEVSLDEPDPNRFIEFWMFSHPSTSERMRFVETYDPWSGGTPKYVK
jgi:Zn-dependent protease with chaperone function